MLFDYKNVTPQKPWSILKTLMELLLFVVVALVIVVIIIISTEKKIKNIKPSKVKNGYKTKFTRSNVIITNIIVRLYTINPYICVSFYIFMDYTRLFIYTTIYCYFILSTLYLSNYILYHNYMYIVTRVV